MAIRFSYLTLAVLAAATTLLDTGTAEAQPEVRDHRSQPTTAQPGPVVSGSATVRYRRRPGPRFMMPLKIDIGATGSDTSRGFAGGVGGAIGIHWASLSPNPTNFDIGIGVFGALLGAPVDMTVPTSEQNNTAAYGGAYLELAHTLSSNDWFRTWASGRGEYLGSTAFGEDKVGFGASGRLSAELYLSGVGIEPRGVFLGTYAIGVYVEAGMRDVTDDLSKFGIGAGLTFRTPLVFSP